MYVWALDPDPSFAHLGPYFRNNKGDSQFDSSLSVFALWQEIPILEDIIDSWEDKIREEDDLDSFWWLEFNVLLSDWWCKGEEFRQAEVDIQCRYIKNEDWGVVGVENPDVDTELGDDVAGDADEERRGEDRAWDEAVGDCGLLSCTILLEFLWFDKKLWEWEL